MWISSVKGCPVFYLTSGAPVQEEAEEDSAGIGCTCWSKDLADELDLGSEIKRNEGWLLGFQPQHLRAPLWDGEDGRSGSSVHVMWTSLISGYGRRDVQMWKFDSEWARNHRGLFHHPFPSLSACSPTLIWCVSAQMEAKRSNSDHSVTGRSYFLNEHLTPS